MGEIEEITLNSLINEGEENHKELCDIEKNNIVIRMSYYDDDDLPLHNYSMKISNIKKCNEWICKTKRYLLSTYKGDFQIGDFNSAITKFENEESSINLDNIISLLKAYKSYPQTIMLSKESKKNVTQVNINNNLNQNQSQQQSQSVEIFIEAIKDDLTGKQVKELKEIIAAEENNLEKAKPKLLEKILSWGGDVAAGIVTNLITNPSIWGRL